MAGFGVDPAEAVDEVADEFLRADDLAQNPAIGDVGRLLWGRDVSRWEV